MKTLEYLETILYDTPIFKNSSWESIVDLTYEIETVHEVVYKFKKRKERIILFIKYLQEIEFELLNENPIKYIGIIEEIKEPLYKQLETAERNARLYYGKDRRVF